MFENILNFFKKFGKNENKETNGSKDTAKERLHLVLMQDRANVSADFLELMKQEIIDVIKKYIEVEENEIDVRITNELKEDGTTGEPSLYANIPICNIRNDMKKEIEGSKKAKSQKEQVKKEEAKQEDKTEEHEKKEEKESVKESTKEEIKVNTKSEEKKQSSEKKPEENKKE